MAFNGTGTFSLVAGNPVVTGTVISSTVHNNTMSDIANNGLSNCITKDGQTNITQNIPLNNKKITTLGAATLPGDAVRASQVQSGELINLTSVSGADTITAVLSPSIEYTSGQLFVLVPAGDNTAATTININSLGAKDIYFNGAELAGGELKSGEPALIRYNGTQFDLFDLYKATVEATETVAGAMTFITAHRKNLIINGNKIVNQQGSTSLTELTDDYNYDTFYYDGNYVYVFVEDINLREGVFTLSWDSNNTAEWQLISNATSSAGLSAITAGWTAITNGGQMTLTGVAGNHLWVRFASGVDGLNALNSVQLEPGNVATDFEYRLYQQELALCQRYYWQGLPGKNLNSNAYTAGAVSSWPISFPVEMRATPTLSLDLSGSTLSNINTPNWTSANRNSGRFLWSSTTTSNNCICTFGESDFLAADARI